MKQVAGAVMISAVLMTVLAGIGALAMFAWFKFIYELTNGLPVFIGAVLTMFPPMLLLFSWVGVEVYLDERKAKKP